MESGGLCLALAELIERARENTGIETAFTVCGPPAVLPVQVEDDLLRIAQEGVTNALKHAQATRITIHLEFAPDRAQMRVEDDGRGLPDPALRAPTGFGLIGMRERAARIGGTVTLHSRRDEGTKICVTVPLAAPLVPFERMLI